MRKIIAHFLFALVLVLPGFAQADIKADIEKTSLQYFIDHAHPKTGLVRDKAENFQLTPASNRVSSMAATGFGIAVIANASIRGMVSKKFAQDYITKVLTFSQAKVPRYKGWFLHWVDWETGARAWESEYSPIDTALFMAGAMYASAIFPDSDISRITRELYIDMDYHSFLTDDGKKPNKLTLSLSYTKEKGFVRYQWRTYAEQMILLVMGLGHPTKPLSIKVWEEFERQSLTIPKIGKVVGYNMPLFIHQYSHLYLDFRGLKDINGGVDYFDNSVRATKLHRALKDFKWKSNRTFDEGFWGVSAGESPDGYGVYHPLKYKATVCIGCTVASAMFLPEVVLKDADEWKNGVHRKNIWGTYGFVDSIDLERGWYSPMVLGITVGPEYLALANLDEAHSVWSVFMKIPEIRAVFSRIMKE